MLITDIIKEKQNLQAEYKLKAKEFEEFKAAYNKKMDNLSKLEIMNKGRVDCEKFLIGENLLDLIFPREQNYYSGRYIYKQISKSIIKDAMSDIASGCPKLSKMYFAQKKYSCFDQREDFAYGQVPHRGSICQKIGLKDPSKSLTEKEVEACLYFLANINLKIKSLNKNEHA